MDEDRVIGADGGLPWHISGDMKRFAALTRGHTVLMGSNTYRSLPEKYRPLPGRENIIATRNAQKLQTELKDDRDRLARSASASTTSIKLIASPVDFIAAVRADREKIRGEILWIIGGAQIYGETLPLCDAIDLALVRGKHRGDVYLPRFESEFIVEREEPTEWGSYRLYKRQLASGD